jgi:hypothetical protein
MIRSPRKGSAPPRPKSLGSGEVLVRDARSRLPTLTDAAEVGANAEDTEKDPESARQALACSPLPGNISAEVVWARRSHAVTMIRTLIGRGNDAQIRIEDRRASRRHACIFFAGTEFRIRDEGSANGTLLNGSKVVEYIIRDGDELAVGDTVMRFHVRRSQSSRPPPSR